jgi:hypothetical protein
MAIGDSVPSTYRQKSGLGHAPAYQVSGRPWMTGSQLAPSGTITINFPSVTKNFTIVNTRHSNGSPINATHTGSLAVYFGPTPEVEWDGTNIGQIYNNHYVFLDEPNDSYTFETKAKTVHITCLGYSNYLTGVPTQYSGASGSFWIIAELTGIDQENMYELTGSGIDE